MSLILVHPIYSQPLVILCLRMAYTNTANVDTAMTVSSVLFYIVDIVTEDTANYTCIVSGPHNVILASVTHLIQVRGI